MLDVVSECWELLQILADGDGDVMVMETLELRGHFQHAVYSVWNSTASRILH